MCRAVKFLFDDREWEMRFGQSQARLPIRDKDGQIQLCPWGRRPRERGKLPMGGVARLTHVRGERWEPYFPKPVRVMVKSFAVSDVAGNEHWFALTRGQFLHGLRAYSEQEMRIYLITLDSTPEEAEFEHWPRILAAP